MSVPLATSPSTTGDVAGSRGAATAALAAAVLGFFVITLDATVVNVALPAIRDDFGGGMTGLQWVLDSYTLMFAALLLSAGAVSDRIGAHRAFGTGMAVFVAASVACGLAPNVGALIAARAVQGAGAATMLPASLALIGEAFPDSVRRARAIAVWTIAGSVAAAAGPVSGGALSLASWRMIFFINLPVGVAALFLLARAVRSPRRPVPFDWTRQVAAVVALGALTFAAIEAGADGFGAPKVLVAFAVAAVAAAAFVAAQVRGKHPMVPMDLLRSRTMRIASANGFAFIAGLNGTVFLYSLCLQQERGLSALAVGLVCLPMAALSAFLGVPTARLTKRYGPRVPIVGGFLLMGASLVVLAVLPASAPVWLIAVVMIPVGCCGPLAMQPTTGLFLENVPAHRSGVASAVFNTSRQIGGALAVAAFGALLVSRTDPLPGLRASLLIAAVLVIAAATANVLPERRGVLNR
ncbi:MFS transporter [Streptomyces sp. NBC_00268]|uniref:MFS transporter n=1 Tax=Streptomyces sp. NBC_00268 TaxID=2975695 RepID=UPI002251E8C0|nr:MFS transporter [Streptomyces sp. NBC_00268]MCX5190860.1 MFS transporter [Streptomyces sp. NBC_00268]